ncbi:MAG: excalibur calcium-binding domain-containing protein [Rugosibacter sp.]|jgi:predicted negative regulator of RcsB-dependent stress response
MKKLIIFAVLVAFGWNYYQKGASSTQAQTQIEPQAFQAPVTLVNQPTENFSCDGRQHCSQMRSRAEAEFFLKNCPGTKMDGDNDGIPCENDSRF